VSHSKTSRDDPRCPACDYDLRGNPATTACPECGFEHGDGAITFKPSGALCAAVPYLMAGDLFLFAYLWYRELVTGFPNWGVSGAVAMGIALVFPLQYVVRRMIFRHATEFLRLGSESLHWRLTGYPQVTIPWSNVTGVRKPLLGGFVVLRLADSGAWTWIPRCFCPKSTPFEEFVEIVRSKAR
jgi:hypothetical protein